METGQTHLGLGQTPVPVSIVVHSLAITACLPAYLHQLSNCSRANPSEGFPLLPFLQVRYATWLAHIPDPPPPSQCSLLRTVLSIQCGSLPSFTSR